MTITHKNPFALTINPFDPRIHLSLTYLEWVTDESVTKYIPTTNSKITYEELASYVNEQLSTPGVHFFAISAITLSNSVHIGNCKLRRISHDTAIISLLIGNKSYRGLGLGRAIVAQLLDYASSQSITTLLAEIHPNNKPSIRLFQNLGFKPVASSSTMLSYQITLL